MEKMSTGMSNIWGKGEISRSDAIVETRVGSSHLSPHADEETFQVCHLFSLSRNFYVEMTPTQRKNSFFFFIFFLKIKTNTNTAHISGPCRVCRVPVWSTRMLMRAHRYIPLKKQNPTHYFFPPLLVRAVE